MKSNSIGGLGSRYLYEFSLSNNYMSSLRTTTCDALIVPSDASSVQIKSPMFPIKVCIDISYWLP